MIDKVGIFKICILNLPKKILTKQRAYFSKFPKLKQLCKDVVEFSKKCEPIDILPNSPGIIEGKFYSNVKDFRLKHFVTEFRAYNYQGYDTTFPNSYLCIDSKGEIRLKPHIYLTLAEVKPEYARQGAFTNAMKQLIKLSKNSECEGRIILNASKIESPYTTKIPSPSLAHWKCGFRFANKEDNKIMEQVLSDKLPLEAAPEGLMYYAGI